MMCKVFTLFKPAYLPVICMGCGKQVGYQIKQPLVELADTVKPMLKKAVEKKESSGGYFNPQPKGEK